MALFIVSCTDSSTQSEEPKAELGETEKTNKPVAGLKNVQTDKESKETNKKKPQEKTKVENPKKTEISKAENPQQTDFKEIDKLPDNLLDVIGFEAVRYYQSGETIYLLTPSKLNDKDLIEKLRNVPDGVCSEVWSYNTRTKALSKLFVKYDYDFGDLRQGNNYGVPGGQIFTIDDVDENGNVFFTEKWSEGMMHYGTRKFQYRFKEHTIETVDFKPARPEIYSLTEIVKIENEVFNKDILEMFRQISDLIQSDSGKSSFQRYANGKLYAVKYNLQDEQGAYYHEIGAYDVVSGSYLPLIRKMVREKTENPLIYVNKIDADNNLTIHELYIPPESGLPVYFYNAEQNTITLQSGSVETGEYFIVSR